VPVDRIKQKCFQITTILWPEAVQFFLSVCEYCIAVVSSQLSTSWCLEAFVRSPAKGHATRPNIVSRQCQWLLWHYFVDRQFQPVCQVPRLSAEKPPVFFHYHERGTWCNNVYSLNCLLIPDVCPPCQPTVSCRPVWHGVWNGCLCLQWFLWYLCRW